MRVIALSFAMLGFFSSPALAVAAGGALPVGEAAPITAPIIAEAPLKEDYVLGAKGAPVTIIEYASLSCPHCAHFHNEVLPSLQKQYIDAGKLRLILRPYPLNEPALKAAMLVDCVGAKDPGQYYTFAKVLFSAQDKWAFDHNFLASLERFASIGGVSKEEFQRCVSDSERETKILTIKKSAFDSLQIKGTPAFFINGERYEGALSPEGFAKVIDRKLGKP